MSRQGIFTEYKGLTIYEKDGLFTVGGSSNFEFEDCTLENLGYGPDEFEIVQYCRENGILVQFDDLRGHMCDVPYEKYLEHLDKFKVDPDGGFLDNEFIAPVVQCVSVEQAKGLIDWIDDRNREIGRLEVEGVISDAKERAGGSCDREYSQDISLV